MQQACLSVRSLHKSLAEDSSPKHMVRFHSSAEFASICRELLLQARTEVYVSGESIIGSTIAELATFQQTLQVALRRRVQISMLDGYESAEDSDRRQFLHELKSLGASVRVGRSVDCGVMITDRRVALICDNSVRDRQGCASIRSSAIVASLQRLADISWRTSWDLELLSELKHGRDSHVSLEVLELLGAGYKDEIGARMLGISLRTYRRHVADLINMLQAGSRFEAGVRAARLGLLS